MDRGTFCGRWRIDTQEGRDAILQEMDLPYVIRVLVQALTPPDQTLFFEGDVLMNHTGPAFGRVMEEAYVEGDPVRHSFRGLTSITEYRWEGNVLTSTVRTEGKEDLAINKRWVAPHVGTLEQTMVVVNEYVKAPGRKPVTYTRTYRRVLPQGEKEKAS